MATKYQLTVTASVLEGTSAVVNRVFPIDDTTITEYLTDIYEVAAGATDLLISLAGISTAKHLLLSVDGGPLDVKLNGAGNPAIPLADGGLLVLSKASVTAIYVTNNDEATAVTLKRVAAG